MAKFNMSDLLNQQSKKAQGTSGSAFTIRQIPIGQIVPSDKNAYGIRDLEELAANIDEFGLMHNLVVKEANAGGSFEIISGERRYRACKMLFEAGDKRFATLPCKVESASGDEISELKLLYANAMARELTDYEKTHQVSRIKELLQELKNNGHTFKGRMREIVAEILDVSASQVGRMESIGKNLSPAFQEEFKQGNIGITQAYELSTRSDEAQADALKSYRTTGAAKKTTGAAKKASPSNAPGMCICCYCGERFNGRDACNGSMDTTSFACPACGRLMRVKLSVRFSCMPLDIESDVENE